MTMLPFEEGRLPIRYLGVPLISSRLSSNDCKVLIERMEDRIKDWKNNFLSFAGKLQLIISVLSSLYIYWTTVFILPASTIKELEKTMRSFLWCKGTETTPGRAKVSWNEVCLPKAEGGLGIRRIKQVNTALIASHIYSIITKRKSLWVDWIHTYRLKGRSLWSIKPQNNAPWTWRKIMQTRETIRPFLWSRIGNGCSTFLWHDNWSNMSPCSSFMTPRNMNSYGYDINSKVKEAINDNVWNWPEEWRSIYPQLFQIQTVSITNSEDKLVWKDETGILREFSTKTAWNSIRNRADTVQWDRLVWTKFVIPRHAFHSWLIFKGKLPTQDRIRKINRISKGCMNMMSCLLCNKDVDSHKHLFFECDYSNQIWIALRQKAGMSEVKGVWSDIVAWLNPRAGSMSAISVIGRLLVAAVAYYVWQ